MKKTFVIAGALAVGIIAAPAHAAGLGPGSYVQPGLVTQFDSIDNEGTGVHNS